MVRWPLPRGEPSLRACTALIPSLPRWSRTGLSACQVHNLPLPLHGLPVAPMFPDPGGVRFGPDRSWSAFSPFSVPSFF